MKLRATYDKPYADTIDVTLEVTDRGDFTDLNIFYNDEDFPCDSGYQLASGYQNTIVIRRNTVESARMAVRAQVQCLAKHLNAWRETQVPEAEEFEI